MSKGCPRKPPLVYRLFQDASGQSETFGVLLLLAITVVGTTAIVALGSQALNETEQASELQRTEHTMTLLDSRAAMVALGDSEQQSVDFSGTGDGSFHVDSDAGWINVTHKNVSGNGDDEAIYNRSLGKMVYENGDTEIAYQGGGVWRVDDDGSARMVSKPEFHYRGATLTLPIIRMEGDGQAAGDATVTVRSEDEVQRVFPNSSKSYDVTDGTYSNPIMNGTINVTVHSEYYRSWADFFRTRTDTNVTVYDSNQTVHMQLLTLSDVGDFNTLTNTLNVGGYPEGHSLTDFTTTFKSNKDNWEKMHWSYYVDNGNEKFEMHVTPTVGKCSDISGAASDEEVLKFTVFYTNTSSSQTQEWQNANIEAGSDFLEGVDCDADELTVNFTAQNTDVRYQVIDTPSCGNNNQLAFSDEYEDCGGDGVGSATFDHHDADAGATDCCPYRTGNGDTENVSFVVNHYFALLGPNFELKGMQGPGQGNSEFINADESSGTLSYDQDGEMFLTYLHVTENEIEVEIE